MGNPKKILLVDDDRIHLKMLKLKLEKTGRFGAIATTEGGKAVYLAKEHSPDLIILDILMPGMFGGEVATALRRDVETCTIPILFLSSMVRKEDLPLAYEKHSGENVASKSMTIKELISKIDSMIDS